jgi:hypothetical protein
MQHWIVPVTPEQLARLSAEERNLGTLLTSATGEQTLLFRDNFVALKVARSLGGRAQPYSPPLRFNA